MKATVVLTALLPACLYLTGCNPDSGTTAAVVKPASAPATTGDAAKDAARKPAAGGGEPDCE